MNFTKTGFTKVKDDVKRWGDETLVTEYHEVVEAARGLNVNFIYSISFEKGRGSSGPTGKEPSVCFTNESRSGGLRGRFSE